MKTSTHTIFPVIRGGWALGFAVIIAISSVFADSYDLRSVQTDAGTVAWVPAIQNQGTAEDCWTFASATAMNSSLLKQGLLPTAAIAPEIQISSWHLSTANGTADQLLADKALGNDSNWGGFEYMNLGYISRGSGSWQVPDVPHHDDDPEDYVQTFGGGPVLVSNNPLNVFPQAIADNDEANIPANLGSLLPPRQQPIAYQVKTMTILNQGFSNNVALPSSTGTYEDNQGQTFSTYNFTQGKDDAQVQAVKAAILKYGAVTTSMNASEQDITFKEADEPVNGLNVMIYQNNTTATAFIDHEVTIIGWDDDYEIQNENLNITTHGAWLVQNSWGSTSWNNSDGTFWAAYDDASIGRIGVSAYELRSNAPYSSTVIQNELGPMEYANNYQAIGGLEPEWDGSPTGMATATANLVASVLTPAIDGRLAALGVAIQQTSVEIRVDIYGAWVDGPDSSTLLLGNEIFELEGIGYHVIDLSQQIVLTAGDGIIVQLTYLDADGNPLANAIPIVIGDGGLHGDYLNPPDGLSYYWNGSDWVDFATMTFEDYDDVYSANGGVLFLKGIMAVPEPGSTGLLIFGIAVVILRRRARNRFPHHS